MSRTSAIVIVLLFAAGGIAVFWWGLSDVLSWARAMADCAPEVAMDTSAFWFLGAVAVAVLPLLALIKDKYHTTLFALMVGAALGLPAIGYFWISSQAQTAGYDTTALPSLFSLQAFTLGNATGCGG